ncbi:protein FAR1-RELATED SEQUENCE 1-like [Tripterygium wilfordii]|uniref:protein FAR1-RELATED SEQUENCE 1-like n=1 Tax=Tripterygium wilfordii TaxID=458696 RepID=UPI0018F84F78|nr:protein FAR1-RELATED SEQUENCE 1-like [Tripterygium wilfordii]
MEKQIRDLYTVKKFGEFQMEIIRIMYCGIKSMERGGYSTQYIIYEDVVYNEGGRKKMLFTVMYNEVDVICSRMRFEFKGILCRHALNVLLCNDHVILPDKYVFRRWRKDARGHMRVKIKFKGCIVSTEQHRYDTMCKSFTTLTDIASENEESYVKVILWIESLVRNMTVIQATHLVPCSAVSKDSITKRSK